MTDYVTVVSGLPRSGTSMMMRMLQAGGMQIVSDGRRAPDEHNAYGYFEDERVMRLARDAGWLDEARGKAIKVIYRLLQYLPANLDYRVIYLVRDFVEVLDSQQKMLLSRGDAAAQQDRQSILSAFARDEQRILTWLQRQPNFRSLVVPYAQPSPEEIARFLDRDLDLAAMRAAYDPSISRSSRPAGPSC